MSLTNCFKELEASAPAELKPIVQAMRSQAFAAAKDLREQGMGNREASRAAVDRLLQERKDHLAQRQKDATSPAAPDTPAGWKATPEVRAKAREFTKANDGLKPYLSDGQRPVTLDAAARATPSFSIKEEGKYGNHPLLDIPVNANGTVSLYYPTTNDRARAVVRDRAIRGESVRSNRIWLTNESSGPAVMNRKGQIENAMDGANVLVQVDPSMVHLAEEHADGRKDFFIPIAEGKSFADKMLKMVRLFTQNAPRDKGLSADRTLKDIETGVTDAVAEFQMLDPASRRDVVRKAKEVLRAEHNVSTLLGVNGKLEKTNTGGYGLNDYNGKDVMSMGLGLASAQKINDLQKLTTCPQSAICEALCLGETSGQNLLYGGEGQYRSGPRMAQYLKTEALVQHSREFAIALFSEIERFAKQAKAGDYQATVRLNVTSDFHPKTFEAVIRAFPEVMFYDYTKLDTRPIAENHHLTYSSTGASQVVNGKTVINPHTNWDRMTRRLDDGANVAMAFTSKTDMPKWVVDEATGKKYEVWNGDNYDARFLDPKREDGVGMIIGLTNKDRTGKAEGAAERHRGFFLDYDAARDGDTLTIRDQKALAGERKVIQISPAFSREENETRRSSGMPTREIQVGGQWRPIEDSSGRVLAQGDFLKQTAFYKWFGESKVVDEDGRPRMMLRGLGGQYESRQGLQFWTDNAEAAAEYNGVDNLTPAYLSVRNPLVLKSDAAVRKLAKALGVHWDDSRYYSDVLDASPEAAIKYLRAQGYDGVVMDDGTGGTSHETVVTIAPEQVKSAIGNNGDYAEGNPDIRFARATPPPAGLPAAAPSSRMQRGRAVISDLLDEGLSRSGIFRLTAPMSEGTPRAKAVAQNFINAERRAREEWTNISTYIEKNFDQAARERMWNAADEENEILSGRVTWAGSRPTNMGLDALNAKERAVVDRMHIYGEELLARAKAVGMFQGDGVPYWTPRMMVMLDQNGDYVRPPTGEPGKKQTSSGDGRNVVTSSSNLKQRKHLTAEDTEAAMNAKGGDLVRDIQTMPMAMARLERAIAGRELVNQIKELGRATGQQTVSTGRPDHDGWFTLDHGSFTTWQPRFVKDEATGKTKALLDENGEMVFDRVPLYMSKEFEGPVRAILSGTDGPTYRAFMLLKSKAMSAIMFSPLIHNMVIFGRALGYDPTVAGTVGLYVKGAGARKDRDLVREAIDHGMVPMGYGRNGMLDITDVARGFGREGGPLDMNESLVAHGAGAIVGLVNKKLGAKTKAAIDAVGDFWHGTLLWERIADLQMGIFQHARDKMLDQGFSENVASTMAAHWANRYAGAVGRENMSTIARKAANVLLFSRSFNMGNVGTIKDLFFGLPEGLRGKILAESPAEASDAFAKARRKAWGAFTADAAWALIGITVAQSAVDYLKKDKGWDEIFGGYTERAKRMWENVKAHPGNPKSYNPLQISPTFDNEPGKEERVDFGEIPDQGARHQYMRLPTGKVVEDLFHWMLHPAETFSSKMSPLAKAVWQVIQNDKGFEVPVFDPNGSAAKAALDIAAHLAKAQTPWDTIVTGWDKLHGKTTSIENDKLVGQVTGFTWSQGHPLGPEGGVAAEVTERVKQQRLYAMEEVKRLLRYDNEEKARQRLEEVGLTPKEISSIIKRLEKPKDGLGRQQRRNFNQHSTDEEKGRMDTVTR